MGADMTVEGTRLHGASAYNISLQAIWRQILRSVRSHQRRQTSKSIGTIIAFEERQTRRFYVPSHK